MKLKTKKGFLHVHFILNPFRWQFDAIKMETITGYMIGPIELNFHH